MSERRNELRGVTGSGVGGLPSTEMVRRYAHLAADHPAPDAEPRGALRAVQTEPNRTDTAQARNEERARITPSP